MRSLPQHMQSPCPNLQSVCSQVAEFWGLGLEPLAVSAISGSGTGELMERLVTSLPKKAAPGEGPEQAPAQPLGVAIIGRPNVGKSSLLNTLVRAHAAPNACSRLVCRAR